MRPETKTIPLGQSVQGRPLEAVSFCARGSQPRAWLLLLGAVHGDEIEGVWLLEEARRRWEQQYAFTNTGVVVLAQVNPDGVAAGRRWNANDIDLNRNLPTKDWSPEIKNPRYPPGTSPCSEPENKALLALLSMLKPTAILSVHSFSKYQVNANGPSRAWAEKLSAVCGYPVTEDIGYPTPGCLGTLTGAEQGIPTITLEIERGLPKEKVLELHWPVLEAAIRFWEEQN